MIGFDGKEEKKKGLDALVKGAWYSFTTEKSFILGKFDAFYNGEVILSESIRSEYTNKGLLAAHVQKESSLSRNSITGLEPLNEEEVKEYVKSYPSEGQFIDNWVLLLKDSRQFYGVVNKINCDSIFLLPHLEFKSKDEATKNKDNGVLIYKPFNSIEQKTEEFIEDMLRRKDGKNSLDKSE